MADVTAAIDDAARDARIAPRPPALSDEDIETAAEPVPAHAPTADPVINQWSHVAQVAGQLEQVYQQGVDCFQTQDFEGCVDRMSQVLDEVLVHSMALHYLAQSEEKLRQSRLDEAKREQAAEVLSAMRSSHRQSDPQKTIDAAVRLLAIDPESMEARWYRRAAESRLTPSSRTRAGSVVTPRRMVSSSLRPGADLQPTLIVPAMAPSKERSLGVWVLGGVGMLFLALIGLFWGFSNPGESKPLPVESTVPSNPKVRPSMFDDEDAVVLNVAPPTDPHPEVPVPSVNSALPREIPGGEETVVRFFGRNFSPEAEIKVVLGTRGIDVMSVVVISGELLEATIRVDREVVGRQTSLAVVNPSGARSDAVRLTIVPPPDD
jgi:hypothetical protein